MIWTEKYKGELHSYDIKSMYPSLYSAALAFPIKGGAFTNLKELADNVPVGIYRCEIEETDDSHKLFRYNKTNYYTNVDIKLARALKLKINLIQDNSANALIYKRSCLVLGSQLFKQYVDLLYPIKEAGMKRAKTLLVCLWM